MRVTILTAILCVVFSGYACRGEPTNVVKTDWASFDEETVPGLQWRREQSDQDGKTYLFYYFRSTKHVDYRVTLHNSGSFLKDDLGDDRADESDDGIRGDGKEHDGPHWVFNQGSSTYASLKLVQRYDEETSAWKDVSIKGGAQPAPRPDPSVDTANRQPASADRTGRDDDTLQAHADFANSLYKKAFNGEINASEMFPGKCSDFVSQVLGLSGADKKIANDLMGSYSKKDDYLGKDADYDLDKLKPGDVVGWNNTDAAEADPSGHVAIYVGKGKFLDFGLDHKSGEMTIRVMRNYESQKLYKSARY